MRWVLVFLAIAVGCGRPPVAHPDLALQARAEAALLQGCYDCLLEARDGFSRLGAGEARPAWVARMFEVELLLALRDKELGLSPAEPLATARRLAAELPRDQQAARYLALVDEVPGEELSGAPRALQQFWSAHQEPLRSLAADRAWLARGPLGQPLGEYLRLALDCAHPERPAGGATSAAPPAKSGAPGAPPLLAYRAAICGYGSIDALAAVRAREPRFVETSFFIAKDEVVMMAHDGPARALPHLTEVLARFPGSPALAHLMASYQAGMGNYGEAVRFDDRALAAFPEHDDARFGRLVALSYLGRSQDAIDTATVLIDRHAVGLANAYYWRARNHRALAQLTEARADITAAKELLTTPVVMSLAGMIEYDQRELDIAEADLHAALDADPHDCDAQWYVGLVHQQRKQWRAAAQALDQTTTCFRERAAQTAAWQAALQARGELDPAYRASAVAGYQASIDDDRRRQHLAALNAAAMALAGSDFASARASIEVAAEDPSLADQVARLRARLDRPRRTP